MERRCLLGYGAAGAAWLLLSGHSPYRQFQLYRKTRLIIVNSKADPRANLTNDALARLLAKHWPDSSATSARARDSLDVVRLLAGKQLDVGLMRRSEAVQAWSALGPFKPQGPTKIVTLAAIGDYLLVCRQDLLAPVARKLVSALIRGWSELDPGLSGKRASPEPDGNSSPPIHATALEYYRSRPHSGIDNPRSGS